MAKQSKSIKSSFFWKLLERFSALGIQFVISMVLARMLEPEHYGVLSLMMVFITLATVFVQTGFSTSLVQNKDVTDEDYSTVFWASLAIAIVGYCVLFFAAPIIAAFYAQPDIVLPFRILTLSLIPGAFSSVQHAKVNRELDFKKVFYSNIGASLVAGIISILLALRGAGLWALVCQSIISNVVVCLVMYFTVDWRPRFVFNLKRLKVLLAFGWKILVSNLLDAVWQDISSLVIGKKYSADTLGYYNRGRQFPQIVSDTTLSTIQSVMLPVMSAEQENIAQLKLTTRNAVKISAFIIFPIMAGLAAVASPLVTLLLTEKWLPAVPYMQIFCANFALYPIHASNLQAINALGRSDIFLKLEIVKKVIALVTLCVGVFCFNSPIAIAMTGVVNSITSFFINAYPNKKLINYSYIDQMWDILPSFSLAIVMCIIVLSLTVFSLSPIVLLMIQIVVGVAVYFGLSAIFKVTPFQVLMGMAKEILKKRMIK